jgi:hypothetical protein
MILIGVLVILLIVNIVSGDVFNSIVKIMIISIAGGVLVQRRKGQVGQEEDR